MSSRRFVGGRLAVVCSSVAANSGRGLFGARAGALSSCSVVMMTSDPASSARPSCKAAGCRRVGSALVRTEAA